MNEIEMGAHSASVCEFGEYLYVAFYIGSSEGAEDQHVVVGRIEWPSMENMEILWHFNYGTGNPILFVHNNHLILACNIFRDEAVAYAPRYKWRYTDLLFYDLGEGENDTYTDGAIENYRLNYLGVRNPPIHIGETTYIPAYDEWFGCGFILEANSNWMNQDHYEVSRKLILRSSKVKTIQPTIIQHKQGLLFTLRPMWNSIVWDVPDTEISYIGKNEIVRSNDKPFDFIKNYSESVCLFNVGEDPWIVYNACISRKQLSIRAVGEEARKKNDKIYQLSEVCGSYPYVTKTQNGRYVIVFTEYIPGVEFADRHITLLVLDEQLNIVNKINELDLKIFLEPKIS
jgi:hypothetical protein